MGCILSKRNVIYHHDLAIMNTTTIGKFRAGPLLVRPKHKRNKTEYGGHRNNGEHR